MRRLPLWTVLAALAGTSPARGELTGAARGANETCTDGVRNGPEADIDCGGDCRACGFARTCTGASDCESGLCASGRCEERILRRGASVPTGYDLARSRHDAAASVRFAGALFFGVAFGGAYVVAVAMPRRASDLYVPIVGPWLALDDYRNPLNKTLLASDGALQAGGAILLLAGILGAGRRLVRIEDENAEMVVGRPRRPRWIAFDGTGVSGRF